MIEFDDSLHSLARVGRAVSARRWSLAIFRFLLGLSRIAVPAGSGEKSHRPEGANPEGIPQQSPGLRGTRYPGSTGPTQGQPQRGCGLRLAVDDYGPKPLAGFGGLLATLPRVARGRATLGFVAQSLRDCSAQWPNSSGALGQRALPTRCGLSRGLLNNRKAMAMAGRQVAALRKQQQATRL